MFRSHPHRTAPQQRITIDENAKFVDFADVVGVKVVTDISRYGRVTEEIRRLAGYKKPPMPVNWPVTLTRDHLYSLETSPYVVRLKPEGPRYLLYADNEGNVYMENNARNLFEFDEDHALQIVDYRGQPMKNTLLDGIVTLPVSPYDSSKENCDSPQENSDPTKENCRITFLVHDAIHCNGRDLKALGVMQRIKFVDDEVMKPRLHMIKSGLIDITCEPLDLAIVEYIPASQAVKYLRDDFLPEENYVYKSIIFYPIHEEYVPALPGNLLCWDFEADVNFDFLLKQGDLYVTDRGSKVKFGTITMTDELRKLDDGCIITCFYSDHQWIFKKRRYDRKHPNGLRAANGKFRFVQDPVSKEQLLASLETSEGQE